MSDGNVDVRIDPVEPSERAALLRLLELYQHDFSERTLADVGDDGAFGWNDVDRWWREPDRHPFFVRVDGRLAGFALVRAGDPHDMDQFFVLRKYRRGGVGIAAARAVFARFPGAWQVRQQWANTGAVAFWRRAAPAGFTEDALDEGPVQRFVVPAS